MSYLFVNKGTIKCAHTGTLRIQFSETKLSLDSSLFLVLLVIPADFTQTDRASNEPNWVNCRIFGVDFVRCVGFSIANDPHFETQHFIFFEFKCNFTKCEKKTKIKNSK